jgi:hypothetical protein
MKTQIFASKLANFIPGIYFAKLLTSDKVFNLKILSR